MNKYLLVISFVLVWQVGFSQKNLNTDAFEAATKTSSETTLLDVRTAGEYERGHLINAKNIDWKGDFKKAISSLDKTKPVYVYCYSGGRSSQAMAFLVKEGFKNVLNLEGGYLAWTNRNKTVTSDATPRPTLPTANGKTLLAEAFKKNQLVLVDFYAEWCGPCKQQAPILEKLKKEWTGNVIILKIDTDREPELSKKYGIEEIPTLLLFKNGQPIDRLIGFRTEQNLQREVGKHF